jgi:hypothetical protein
MLAELLCKLCLLMDIDMLLSFQEEDSMLFKGNASFSDCSESCSCRGIKCPGALARARALQST